MFSVKNDIKSTNIMCTGSHKTFPIHFILRGEILKRTLTYSIKCNEIHVCHLYVQTAFPKKSDINSINILNTDSYKGIPIHCGQ